MPRKSSLAAAAGVAAILAIFILRGQNEPAEAESISHKEKILGFHHEHGPRRTAKLTGPMNLRIEVQGEAPRQVGDIYTLVALISSDQALGNIQLRWKLGHHAELVSGSLNQTVFVQPGQEQKIAIIARAKEAGPQRAHLRAIADQTSSPFSLSAHYNSESTPRDFLMTKDQTVGTSEDKPQNAVRAPKIFH